jgi:hypothetical protein
MISAGSAGAMVAMAKGQFTENFLRVK